MKNVRKSKFLKKKLFFKLVIIICFDIFLLKYYYNYINQKNIKEEANKPLDNYRYNYTFDNHRDNYTLKKKLKIRDKSNLTIWGENLDKNKILQEYPRPQFVRDSYLNLNGEWLYSLSNNDEQPKYIGKILVPFSIESPLSGVSGKSLEPGMTLFYKRIVDLTRIKNKGRFLLHFGAVDQFTEVFINDIKVGEHDGGYTSFYFDITKFVQSKLSQTEIIVKVKDNYCENGAAIGKQGNPRGKIFYTKTGGIWQTVWIESVPKNYIKDIKITPLYDSHSVSFNMKIEGNQKMIGKIKIFDNKNKLVNFTTIIPNIETSISISKNFNSWSPENPYLYNVEYNYGEDFVKAYFGMRKFSIDKDKNGINRLFLNNKPYFQKGVLDQGYWSDGYYTAPSDEAIIYDIVTMKKLGFNMLRKHIKIEPKRWYYHCDRIGMIVWQDQVSGGNFSYNLHIHRLPFTPDNNYSFYGRENRLGRKNFMRDLFITIDQLYNSPSISTWVIFNEGWGQFDSVKIANIVKSLDKTRFVDHASGWADHNGHDFKSIHKYYSKIKINPDKLNRPIVLSEYGGLGLLIKNHFNFKNTFSYNAFKNTADLTENIKNLIKNGILPNLQKGLCASVYTQLSDVEEEVNGLMTYDRKIIKVNIDSIKSVNDLLTL